MASKAKIIDFLLSGYTDQSVDEPLANGTVTVTAAGTSNTAYVWDDRDKTLPTTTGRSTITLDAFGRAEVYGDGVYKFVIKDSVGTTVETIDGLEYRSIDSGGIFVDDYTALKAQDITTTPDGTQTVVSFRTTAGDEGGGTFRWDSSDLSTQVTADTLSAIYVPPNSDATGASGAWVRQYSGAIRPKWFGAVGTADDTTVIQGALTFAGANDVPLDISGDVTYTVTALTAAAGVTIVSDGHSKLFHKLNAGSDMLTAAGSITLKDVWFDGNNDNQTVDVDLLVVSTGAIVVEDCVFDNASDRSIGGAVTTFKCTGTKITASDGYPIQVSGATDFLVTDCVITYSSLDTPVDSNVRAIQPTSCTNVIISNNKINTGRQYRDGVWLNNCNFITITGNHILETADDQISIIGDTSEFTIVGNTLRGSASTSGVLLIGTTGAHENCIIANNYIKDCVAGMDIRDAAGLTISANIFDTMQDMIRFSTGAPSLDIVISKNIGKSLTDFGVDCGDSSEIVIQGNQMYGDGSANSIGVHGRSGGNIIVEGNIIDTFEIGIQPPAGRNVINDNKIVGSSLRGISVGTAVTNLSINGNTFYNNESPIVFPAAATSSNVTINSNIFDHDSLKTTNAIDYGSSTNAVINGNIFDNYSRAFVSGAGSDLVIFTSNDDSQCTNAPDFTSLTTFVNANNL